MTTRGIQMTLLGAAFFASGTVLLGWWTLPLLTILAVWVVPAGVGLRAVHLAVAAGIAWAGLLGWRALTSPVGELSDRLAGLFGQPEWVLPVATPFFALGLVWGLATVTTALIKRGPRTRTRESSAPGGVPLE